MLTLSGMVKLSISAHACALMGQVRRDSMEKTVLNHYKTSEMCPKKEGVVTVKMSLT